jgi:hypothetical protein
MCICLAFVSCLGFTSAWAAEETSNKVAAEKASNNVLDNRITLYGGVQIYQAQGDFSSSKEGRPDISVDLGDLDLKENEVSPVVGAIFNFGKRWNLRFDYFGYHDDNKTTADFSFDFDDVTIPVGAQVDSSFDLDLYVLNLAYNLIHSERARFGVGIGFHIADFDAKISGKITVAGSEVDLGEGQEDFVAPLPNLYAYGAYAFTEGFIVRYGGGWMSMSYGDFDGSLYFANAALEYWPFQYVGLGLGYRYLKVDVDYDPGNKTEHYDIKLPGPLFYLTVGF